MNTRVWPVLILILGSAAPLGADPTSPDHDYVAIAGGVRPPAEPASTRDAVDAQSVRDGEILFSAMNCDGCHGVGATGFVGPSLVDGRWRFGGDDRALFSSIFSGRPHGMPAYGGLLSEATIWQLVSYLQAQPVPKEVPTTYWP